ncbi:aminoacyl-histidine dipeptidase [Pelodictyon luteolum]|uniref:Cytosol non-specific dipeptidase n=1 Tax=Chlorobium luteolum (strain DSM 273 / BCRC 81028 / 2530) TaxID=319225 RepID=Q3B5H2_CHLL3|nr:aminoacyl-histidine dipeptidase [Pelodictyon luteolum]ABB23409.1 Pep581 peptidase, Metallo peptidase, MEROPS family M20C [Pelodictyon luteolum DSM 273]
MHDELLQLEPRPLWRHFHLLCQTPRPSGHETAVRRLVVGFGRTLGLETLKDEAGNVIIRKPATPGMEERPGVVLQAHLDMVPQKDAGCSHDFANDPIEAYVDGDRVRARGTTLGADNGIGAGAAMAVLESSTIVHGPLEALFTANEEAGMTGALGLKPGVLKGSILLNLDSEDEGELFIGCAGGLDATIAFDCPQEHLPPGNRAFEVRVKGLSGGHSGMDINLGRANANRVLAALLLRGAETHGMRLASFEGGSLRNAIPREASAVVTVPDEDAGRFHGMFPDLAAAIGEQLAAADPGCSIDIIPGDEPSSVIQRDAAGRFLRGLSNCPNGVIRMSADIDGLVESSSNLAIVRTSPGRAIAECLLRSSTDGGMEELKDAFTGVFPPLGATALFSGGYPGWRPDPASPVLRLMQEAYRSLYGRAPGVSAVHAGLECGIIGDLCPGLDMVSFGPTIRHPHSPGEYVVISSVGRFWDFLVRVLAEI